MIPIEVDPGPTAGQIAPRRLGRHRGGDVVDDAHRPGATSPRLAAPAAAVVDTFLWGRRRMVTLLCVLSLVYLVTSAPDMINDTRAAAAAAWNLATNGTLDVASVGFTEVAWGVVGADGGLYTDRFPGVFLPAVPFYWLAGAGTVVASDSATIPTQPAGVAAALMVAAAVVVLVEVLRSVVDERIALGAGLVAALATPVWSVAARALWPHSVGILVLGLALCAAVRERWWLVGAAMGWAVLTRPTHAVTAAAFGLFVAWSRRSWRVLVAIAIPSLIALAALSWYSHALFGTWLPVAGYDIGRVGSVLGADPAMIGDQTWTSQVWGTLFDRYHGVVPYSLFLVPLVVAVPAGWRSAPVWARAGMVAGLAYWAAQLRGNRFTGGVHFVGYRFPIEPLWLMVPVLVLGWVAWCTRSTWYRRATVATMAVSLVVMVVLVVRTPLGVRDEPGAPVPPLRELPTAAGASGTPGSPP